jgi:CHASE domain
MRDYASVLQSLSTTATSNAQSGQELWPNVTIPFFEIRTHEARRAANLEVFIFAPLVKATHRNEWESYAIQNQAWIREGLEIRNVENVELGSIPSAIFPVHGGDNPYVQETADDQHDNYTLMGYHLPVWQVGGVDATNASMINMDLLSHPAIAASVQRVMTTKRAVLSPIMDVRFLVQVSELEAKDDDAQSSKPYALIVQPVFDSLDENTSSVTGFVIAAFGWHSLFENTPAIRDMVIVLSSSCGGAYTYVLEEKLVELLGPGDVHDQTFNNLQRRYEFEPLDEWDEAMDDGNETECKVRLVRR